MNGARVNAIVGELRGEKIDIITWNENPAMMIENAQARESGDFLDYENDYEEDEYYDEDGESYEDYEDSSAPAEDSYEADGTEENNVEADGEDRE